MERFTGDKGNVIFTSLLLECERYFRAAIPARGSKTGVAQGNNQLFFRGGRTVSKQIVRVILAVLVIGVLVFAFSAIQRDPEVVPPGNDDGEINILPADTDDDPSDPSNDPGDSAQTIDENGVYDSKDDVALYIYTYGHLPQNYITKKEAQSLGWSGGGLEKYAPGKCIGGDYFGNYEELLPAKKGRSYSECDIDTLGASSRGAKRIIYSNDGLIYYTDDHYESFTLLYGEE